MKKIRDYIITAMQPVIIFTLLLILIIFMYITRHNQPL